MNIMFVSLTSSENTLVSIDGLHSKSHVVIIISSLIEVVKMFTSTSSLR